MKEKKKNFLSESQFRAVGIEPHRALQIWAPSMRDRRALAAGVRRRASLLADDVDI